MKADWLRILQVMWPIAVIITPLIVAAGILWLKTQFPTKGELTAHEREVQTDLRKHTDRFEAGSRKFAEHDKRLALVEEDCKSLPTRQSLQGELSNLSQRMRGVEVGFESVGRQLGTTNDYLKIIVDKGLRS